MHIIKSIKLCLRRTKHKYLSRAPVARGGGAGALAEQGVGVVGVILYMT